MCGALRLAALIDLVKSPSYSPLVDRHHLAGVSRGIFACFAGAGLRPFVHKGQHR